MKHLVIAGNIGSGKTNFAKKFSAHKNWQLYEEPFRLNPYIESFYDDMITWAFQSQMHFLTHKFKVHQDIASTSGPLVQDRCIYEDGEIFARNLYNAGFINDHDWQTYYDFYQTFVKMITPPDLLVYLKSSTERCLRNVKKRGRKIDQDIDARYVQYLNNLYEDWINKYDLSPIIVVDMDENDLKYNEDDFNRLVSQIDQYN